MLPGDKLALYPRVIVELGMGDGRLLESLAMADSESLYVGIEIDSAQCMQAQSRIASGAAADNIMILNGSFEELVPAFPDASVDMFVAVLPDPAFIDENRHDDWKRLYSQAYSKLKHGGSLQLVTELTDELLQPVPDERYRKWAGWLEHAFTSLGYAAAGTTHGAPAGYSSRCLDQFRGDPERIRMVTLNLTKPYSAPETKPAL